MEILLGLHPVAQLGAVLCSGMSVVILCWGFVVWISLRGVKD